MKRLYIDFDGVIMDTIPLLYSSLSAAGIDPRVDEKETQKFISKFDFNEIVKDKYILNNSIECIDKLVKSGLFEVSVLTHVNSLEEGVVKVKYLRKYFKDITIIICPKIIDKTDMLHAKDAILVDDFSGNLKVWEKEGGIGVKFSKEKEESEFTLINKLDELIDIYKD